MTSFKCNLMSCIAKSRILASIIFIILLGSAIVTIVISSRQLEGSADFSCGSGCSWKDTICGNDVIKVLSPFVFDVNNNHLSGVNQCPWPITNTLLRIITCSIIVIFSILSIVFIIFFKIFNYKHLGKWKIIRFILLLSFCGIFSSLVLDCHSLNNGYNACKKNFEVNGSIIFNTYIKYEINNCIMTPYIYIPLLDVSTVIFCGICFALNGYIVSNGDDYNKKNDLDNYASINNNVGPIVKVPGGGGFATPNSGIGFNTPDKELKGDPDYAANLNHSYGSAYG